MQTVEVTAKSLPEAKKSAAQKLGVAVDDLQVTVLEESKGLFGKSTVRIRADVAVVVAPVAIIPPPVVEAPPVVKAPRGSKKAVVAEPVSVAEEKTPESQEGAPEEAAPEPATKPVNRRLVGRKPKADAEPSGEPSEVSEGKDPEPTEIHATTQDGTQLLNLTKELIASADLEVSVELGEVAGRYANIILDGKDAAFLVGKHGEVLNAMQYLVNIIAGRKFNNGVRATLDGNDYRKRREEALTALATQIAEQVKERGEEAVLDALPAFERRIVHKALGVITGITTYSEGEEPNRRVVIAPAD